MASLLAAFGGGIALAHGPTHRNLEGVLGATRSVSDRQKLSLWSMVIALAHRLALEDDRERGVYPDPAFMPAGPGQFNHHHGSTQDLGLPHDLHASVRRRRWHVVPRSDHCHAFLGAHKKGRIVAPTHTET